MKKAERDQTGSAFWVHIVISKELAHFGRFSAETSSTLKSP
jgi:hypothetical protein